MSDQDDDKLFDCEVRIKGTVEGLEKLTSKAGKPWARFKLVHVRKYNNEETVEKFEVSIFGKAMEGQCGKISDGDQITAICRVQGDEWKERWSVKLSLKEVKFNQIGNRDKAIHSPASTESGTHEVPAPTVDDDVPLPF